MLSHIRLHPRGKFNINDEVEEGDMDSRIQAVSAEKWSLLSHRRKMRPRII